MGRNIVYFKNCEKIIETGNTDRRMYIILEGEVLITLKKGSQTIVISKLKKGDFFGEISLLNGSPRCADARAIGEVKLAFIENRVQLQKFLVSNPLFAAKMVQVMSTRIVHTNKLITSSARL